MSRARFSETSRPVAERAAADAAVAALTVTVSSARIAAAAADSSPAPPTGFAAASARAAATSARLCLGMNLGGIVGRGGSASKVGAFVEAVCRELR